MTPEMRQQVAHALRAAADAIEAGDSDVLDDSAERVTYLSFDEQVGFRNDGPSYAQDRAAYVVSAHNTGTGLHYDTLGLEEERTHWGAFVHVGRAKLSVPEGDPSLVVTPGYEGTNRRVDLVPVWTSPEVPGPSREAWLGWLASGKAGASSKTMLGVFAPESLKYAQQRERYVNTPWDSGDFGLCRGMVEELGLRDRIHEVSDAYPDRWKVIIDQWDRMCALIDDGCSFMVNEGGIHSIVTRGHQGG